MVKANEILSWLQSHDDVTGWAVLDDLDLHNAKIEQHQVKPDPAIGLTFEDIEKAEKILLNGFSGPSYAPEYTKSTRKYISAYAHRAFSLSIICTFLCGYRWA